MNDIKSILFDLDGTIADTKEGIINCYKYSLKEMGAEVPSDEVLHSFIGPPIHGNFASLLPEDKVNDAVKCYLNRTIKNKVHLTENSIFNGVEEIVEKLSKTGFDLYVCTSKSEPIAKEVVNHFDINKYFKNIYGASADGSKASKELIIERAINENNLTIKNTIMIGDRAHDIEGAKSHGLRAIGVAWGYGSKEELQKAGADKYVETPDELLRVLSK